MHWNDLYRTFRKAVPGLMFPTIQSKGSSCKLKQRVAVCGDRSRRFFYTGSLGALYLLRRWSYRQGRNVLLVHIHTPILAVVAILAILCGTRLNLVTTQHNDWSRFRLHQRICLRALAYLSSGYVCCGRQIVETMPVALRARLQSAGILYSVPNGIPSAALRALALERGQRLGKLPERHGGTTTVVVARMVPQKNCVQLLRLAAALTELGQVRWYGDGPMRADIEEEAARLGVSHRIDFMGLRPRQEVYGALVDSDFYLTVSLWEGLSVADLEAVAIGCWPLMSDILQRRELAEATGIKLLPAEDLEAWRRAISIYLRMGTRERRDAGLALSERACEAFSLEAMVEHYAEVYRAAAAHLPLCRGWYR